MVALVVGLAAAVLFEWSADRHACFQASISAYYYTPVRPYFVSALVAIGVCLVCLRGNTDPEDVLLNVAGVAAAVVGLVPTTHIGSCMSVPVGEHDGVRDVIAGNVANNMFALLVAAAVGLLVFAVVVGWRAWGRDVAPERTTVVAFASAVIVEGAAALVFYTARSFFLMHAHTAAALTMFGCIFVVVSLNAAAHWNGRPWLRNTYVAIASGMALAMLVVGVVALVTTWQHATLVIEGVFITLFATFWSVQTHELWSAGLRPRRYAVKTSEAQ
ncbi:MAG TPA: hypothetical protein VFJ17_15295 [Mycobacteriales bacterium]|jgi:hypothetical protein|nr:hypothetical protein [Mycobacteriales bacterium]